LSTLIFLSIRQLLSSRPVVHPKMISGKASVANAECGVRDQSVPFAGAPRPPSNVAAFGRKPPFEIPAQSAALCRDAATSAMRFWSGERDRPGCRFRRRAGNPSPKLNGSTNGSGATPEPARGTRALPPIVHLNLDSGKEFSSAFI